MLRALSVLAQTILRHEYQTFQDSSDWWLLALLASSRISMLYCVFRQGFLLSVSLV